MGLMSIGSRDLAAGFVTMGFSIVYSSAFWLGAPVRPTILPCLLFCFFIALRSAFWLRNFGVMRFLLRRFRV